jgi:hypothetical protein
LGDLSDETDKLDAVMRAVMDKSTTWVMHEVPRGPQLRRRLHRKSSGKLMG